MESNAKNVVTRESVLAVVTKNGGALEYASPEMQADRKIVLAAVTESGRALEYASPELRADREIVMTAVTENGGALEYASPELRADREVVMTAVKQYGKALEYASPELRADREIVLAGAYDALVARPQEVKPVEQPSYMDRPIVDCTVMDWRVSEGEPLEKLPLHHRDAYNLRITKSRHQAFLDLTNLRGENEAQMTVFVEINEGLPCLHIASSLYDDPLLSIFSTKEGLYVRADTAAPNLAKDLRGQMAQLSEDLVNYRHNTANDRVYRA